MSKNLFVTGTGTDVGKTYVSGLIVGKMLASGAKVAYYKAAMSGNDVDEEGRVLPGDALTVMRLSGSRQHVETACPFVYRHAVSPHLAARWEGRPFDEDVARRALERLQEEYDYVVVEGSGGVVCPMRYDEEEKLLLVDLIEEWRLPCLIVADSGLGTINGAALTAWALHARGIPVRGLILNRWSGDPMQQDNALLCAATTGAPVVAKVRENDASLDVDFETLAALFM